MNTTPPTGSTPQYASRLFGHYLIKQRFQFKFALMVSGFLALATLSIWYFGQMAINQLVTNETIKDALAIEQLKNLNSLVFKISVVFMGLALFVSLMFSHLIAGPIYRFEKTLEGIRDGNLTLFVKLRQRDQFKETAELFNQAISSLRKKIQKERDVVLASTDKMGALAEQLKSKGQTDEAAALDALVKELRSTPPQIKI